MRRVRFLTVQEVLDVHQDVIETHGGSFGLRDAGLLDSAVHQAQASFGGSLLHPEICDMAAAYLLHLTANHPFVDGNKRTAWVSARVFLRLNGFRVKPRRKESVEMVVEIAGGSLRDWRSIAIWIADRITPA